MDNLREFISSLRDGEMQVTQDSLGKALPDIC